MVKALQQELTMRETSSSEPSKTIFHMELVGHKRYKFVQDSNILIVVRELLIASCGRRQNFATECRDGHSFGKLTRYDGDSEGSNYAFNVIMKSVEFGDSKKGSYYSKNGKAVKALNADWKQYSTQLEGYDEPVSV